MGNILPSLVVEVIASVAGVVVSVGVPYVAIQLKKMHKLYVTVFGVQDVESVKGLVGLVESHEQDLREVERQQAELERNQAEMEENQAEMEVNQAEMKGDMDEILKRVKHIEQSQEERHNTTENT